MNERDQLWAEWILGVFGTAALFIALALIGMAMQGGRLDWLGYLLGSSAFFIAPLLVVGSRPRGLSGGLAGVGIVIGGLAVLLIFASIYGIAIPSIVVAAGLILGFLGGSLGEPWLGTA
jgi:hypothetical protein